MTDMTVANTIAAQLGGTRMLKLMTGAKDFVGAADSLKFKIGKNAMKITHVRVTLDPSDTYTVEFMKWNGRKLEMNVVTKAEMIYCDMLMDCFERNTGLYLTLTPRRA